MNNERFLESTKEDNWPALSKLFKYAGNQAYLLYCFVEGKDDEKFYTKVLPNLTTYSEKQIKYIYDGQNGGKDSVYNTLREILDHNIKMRRGTRNAFIVDRDYDGLKKTWIDKNVKTKLTLLPCYSIENYFFFPEGNLHKVFKHYFEICWEKYFDEFQKEFLKFTEGIAEYCAWKKICLLHPKQTDQLEYKSCDSQNEPGSANYILSNLRFSVPFKFEKEFIMFVAEATKELENKFPSLYRQMLEEKESISTNLKYPKGKLLFAFLQNYLRYRLPMDCSKDMREKLFDMSDTLKVELSLLEIAL